MQHIVETEIPDNCFVKASLIIVAYIDSDGRNKYHVTTKGDAAASTWLGMTVLAQRDILDWNEEHS